MAMLATGSAKASEARAFTRRLVARGYEAA